MRKDISAAFDQGDRLRFLVDGASAHALIATDRQGNITFWSKGAEALFGWSADEVLGKSAALIFTAEDRAAGVPEREMAQAARDGRAEDVRWHEREDGSRFWGNGVINRLEDGSGFVKVARDWTAQHETEQALKASEERIRQIIDSAVEYAIFTTDHEGRFTSWNKGAERLVGYTEEEIIGRDVRIMFLPEERERGDPECEMAEALSTGRSHAERFHVRKDGAGIWGSETLMPLQDGAEPTGFLKIMRDRTEEKRAEDALRHSEARFRALATTLPQLIWRSHDDGQWLWASPQWERFTGQTDPETHGLGWLQAVHPDDREHTMKLWHQATETGELLVEHRLHGAVADAYRWFQTRAAPLRDKTGQVVEWFGASTDVEDMKQLDAHQQVLLAELQHRTRNLLGVVQSISSQTIRSSATLEAFEEQFNGRLSALSRVQSLISRSEENAVTIGDIVHLELSAHGAEADGERIVVEGPSVILPGATLQTLTLALHELATNALKYGALARPEGRLEVVWHMHDGDGVPDRLALEWREHGVPLGENFVPQRRGFGRQSIERALAYEFESMSSLEFTPDGVRCLVDVPLAKGRPHGR